MAVSSPALKDRILVIDDEVGPRESLRILLKNDYQVWCTDSVDKGLALLREQAPDVVILDIRMPGKNGIEGLQEIRAVDPAVSVIMLTGFGALETAQQAMRFGANEYLKKPFDTKEIVEVINRNIRRTQFEKRRARAAREIQELNARLMNDLSQKERLASLGQASAEFVHDLRNPLTIIIGYVELLAEQLNGCRDRLGEHGREAGEYLEVIEKNVQRCHELAQMWQNYARGDMSVLEPTPVGELIRDIVGGVEPLAAAAGAQLRYVIDSNGANVMASPPQLLRAIHNVISNAIHAVADQGGEITVECRERGGEVEIRILDNGCGMEEYQLKRAFEPYFTTKEQGKGTGLGLHITKKIVDAHNGTISLESAPGKGTTVTLRLPTLKQD